MAVYAHLTSGNKVKLAECLGETPKQVIDSLFEHMLTGSAAPDVWLEICNGDMIKYTDIIRLESI